MQVDALTLAALADEFTHDLRGARIDDVIQPTPNAVALQTYGGGRNRWLLISTHPQLARIHYTSAKPRKLTAEPPAFVMLLRKHLEGARIVAIRQPRWERMIELGFGRGADQATETASAWLIIEIMGRNSNITLTDAEQVILGALRLASAETNTYRTILPHQPYRYPPPQMRDLRGLSLPKLSPTDVNALELREAALSALEAEAHAELLTSAAGDTSHTSDTGATEKRSGRRRKHEALTVAGLLTAQLLGFSREMGREVAARALGASETPLTNELSWETLASETRDFATLATTHDWRPTLAYRTADDVAPFTCAVYAPRQYAPTTVLQPAESANAMLDTYFKGAEWQGAMESAKGDLRRILQTQRDRCQRKDEALRHELAALDETPRLRTEADILLTYQTGIAPGQTSFTIENPFGDDGDETTAGAGPITLTLDPRLTPVENANIRYARYHKLQRAAEQIPPQIEANTLELARVEQLRADLDLAETPAEVTHVRSEVAEAGYIRGGAEARRLAKEQRGKKKLKSQKISKFGKGGKAGKGGAAAPRAPEGGTPLRRKLAGEFIALIGKNSRQNEEVTFHQAAQNDMWLHARGVAGAHVIVKSGGRAVPEEALREAAALAAYYSQARGEGNAQVDYTEARYVRHMKGGGPGMVIYERERALHVAPAEAGDPA
ncbi:MAG: NFACT family protein [Ktedonobacterales bacterium]